jgi:cofilin
MCRVPNSAPIKAKIVYTGSTDVLREFLFGISADIKATDRSDIAEKAILRKILQSKR